MVMEEHLNESFRLYYIILEWLNLYLNLKKEKRHNEKLE